MSNVEELLQRALEVPTDSVESDLALFAEIHESAAAGDVPLLLGAMKSDRANFWIREMLAEPVCILGGPTVLADLVEAFHKNELEGHDNDSFALFLTELVEKEPDASAEVLRAILEQGDEEARSIAGWLLEFCV